MTQQLPENNNANLTRQELLSAIDFEINHRDSVLSRHGITTWGIAAATIALIWGAATEAASTGHEWTSVLLVLLTGNWLLGFVSLPWTRALGWGSPAEPVPKQYTFKQIMLHHGIDADSFAYQLIPTGLMLAVSIYLAFNGFVLLGIVACASYLIGLIAMSFCWLISRIHIPIRFRTVDHQPGRNLRLALLSRSLSVVVTMVPLYALASAWPVAAQDVRLGLLLGALAYLLSFSASLIRPPITTSRLRSLRSRLALGDTSAEAAKSDVEWTLHGSPDERYVTEKADEVIAVLETYKTLCDLVVENADEVRALADKLQSVPPGQIMLKEIASDFRTLHMRMLADMKSMQVNMEAAIKLRAELMARVEAAKVFLDIKPKSLQAIVQRVDAFGKEADSSRQMFVSKSDQFRPALDLLYNAQKGVVLPRKLTLSDAYVALFRN